MFHNYAVNNIDEMAEEIEYLRHHSVYRNSDIALMPDAHKGKAHASVGFVATYTDKIVPNTVGVDIACRVSAYRILRIYAVDIDFEKLDKVIHERIPAGHSIRQNEHDLSKSFPYEKLRCWDAIKDKEDRYRKSMGTLGGGNHFISIEGDYLLIHCGSRHLGLMVANYYQNKAIAARDQRIKDIYSRYEDAIAEEREKGRFDQIQPLLDGRKVEILSQPDNDLCYIKGQDMEDYLHDMDILRDWSFDNHQIIAHEIFDGMGWHVVDHFSSIHNYVDTEHRIIRKGAISAYKEQLGIVPLNMASGSLIVRGKENEDYLCSAPHGAGRVMSRKEARMTIDMAEYQKAMEGIYTTSVCKDTLDEAPQSYKDADAIIKAIEPTVEVLEHLRPRYNFKAKE